VNDSHLFSLQGYLRIGVRNADGTIGALRWAGNVPEATLELDSSATDKTESYSGKRLQVGRLTTGINAKLNYTLDEWSSANLALAFQASVANVTASTVTGEVLPTGLVAGDLVRLDHPFASNLVITDSAGVVATVDAADYALEGHGQNIVRIIDPTSYTQPFKAAYSYAAAKNVVLFSQPGQEVFVQFDGTDTETGTPIVVDLWRVRHDPVKSMGLIHKEYGSLQMTAAVMFDRTRADDPSLGGFGRLLEKATA
jgi:hypothetical protein